MEFLQADQEVSLQNGILNDIVFRNLTAGQRFRHMHSFTCRVLAYLFSCLIATPLAIAQTPAPGMVLLTELRQGGLVIYFRHMHADIGEDAINEPEYWKDCKKQRNLSTEGRLAARRLGLLIKGLGIPISRVRTGELCRAKQSAELLSFASIETTSTLNDYNTWKAQGNDVQKLLSEYERELSSVPEAGNNTVLISHAQRGRFSAHPALDLIEMGTAAVFRPLSDGKFELRGIIRPGDWERLGFVELPTN